MQIVPFYFLQPQLNQFVKNLNQGQLLMLQNLLMLKILKIGLNIYKGKNHYKNFFTFQKLIKQQLSMQQPLKGQSQLTRRGLSDALKQINTVRNLKKKKNMSSIAMFCAYGVYAFYFLGLPMLIKQFWPAIKNLYSNGQIYFDTMSLINVFMFWFVSFSIIFVQRLELPWIQKLKITQKKWPWQQNTGKWASLLKNTVLVIFVNGVIISSVIMLITLLRPLPYDFSEDNWPSPLKNVSQIFFFMLVQDCLFYFTHRLLHKPQFYQFHKRHHEYNQTVLTAVQYSHPIDYIVSSLVPFSAGFVFLALITNVHFVTVALWVIYRSYQTIIGHCGYDLVFDPGNLVPFCIGADHHDFHHANSSGNYGSLFMFWDALFGTQKDYVSWLRKKVENQRIGNKQENNSQKNKQL